jgi:catechol 2,3-dioxygenase-like lactoylglutathione lyase family enzyme
LVRRLVRSCCQMRNTTTVASALLIHHVSFEVKPDQLEACIEFYELLGFRRVTAPRELAAFVTWLERDGDQVHLLQLPET